MKMTFHPQPIHENCKGCARVKADTSSNIVTCSVFENPTRKWEHDPKVSLAPGVMMYCNMATHVDMMPEEIQKKINPLKASKRAAGKGGKKKK